ncbi:uncharacterized protein LOC133173595 isoform X2 [Saccostrea echinata]|uniref:uncharacterized protein LOC133173595 isoform X2 n=1 Tax=Saccostrea echinata TaxID=191078 RepID=UPI002A83791C|nr:uncharacterized protein LOC133173595 isoform X2 [Saccostrea echinata]
MHLKGRRNKSRWTRKMGMRQMLRAQETQRTAIQELESRIQRLAVQRETADADTLQSMTGGQQKQFFQTWIGRNNPFNKADIADRELDNIIDQQKVIEKWNQKWKTARITNGDSNQKTHHHGHASKEKTVNMTFINAYVRAVVESAYLLWYWEVCLLDSIGDYKSDVY